MASLSICPVDVLPYMAIFLNLVKFTGDMYHNHNINITSRERFYSTPPVIPYVNWLSVQLTFVMPHVPIYTEWLLNRLVAGLSYSTHDNSCEWKLWN